MKFDLSATVREQVGKGAARSMRRAGKVPAVLYGQGWIGLADADGNAVMVVGSSEFVAAVREDALVEA